MPPLAPPLLLFCVGGHSLEYTHFVLPSEHVPFTSGMVLHTGLYVEGGRQEEILRAGCANPSILETYLAVK